LLVSVLRLHNAFRYTARKAILVAIHRNTIFATVMRVVNLTVYSHTYLSTNDLKQMVVYRTLEPRVAKLHWFETFARLSRFTLFVPSSMHNVRSLDIRQDFPQMVQARNDAVIDQVYDHLKVIITAIWN